MGNENLKPSILYVDDEENNLVVFNATFRRDYDIHLAKSGKEGLEIMRQVPVQLIITDQRMPEMTGIQFLEKVIPDYPDCIRMILTGFSDIEAIIQAINTGSVYRYITKPWNREELKINIDKGLETYRLKVQNRLLLEDLITANKTLEQKVIERTTKITEQNHEIQEGIQYAGRIQKAMLTPVEELNTMLPPYFVYTRPKEMVSGDFMWVNRKNDKILVAVADCTGHGVSGAFMSALGMAFLNEVLNRNSSPDAAEMLNQLRSQVIRSLHQKLNSRYARDGMELALCVFDFQENILQFSGAFRPLYLIRNNDLIELEGNNMPIGIYDDDSPFKSTTINLKKDDVLYMFTDGYIDQKGQATGKKFKSSNLKKLLLDIHGRSMTEQKNFLDRQFEEWKGNTEQVDDVFIIGIRIN